MDHLVVRYFEERYLLLEIQTRVEVAVRSELGAHYVENVVIGVYSKYACHSYQGTINAENNK